MKDQTKRATIVLAAGIVLTVTAGSAVAATATKKRPPRVSASQLFLRLDAIDKRLRALDKKLDAAPAQPVAATPAPRAGITDDKRVVELARAYYNYGAYQKQATHFRMAGHIVRDLAIVAGGVYTAIGWEIARKRGAPRTFRNAFKDYASMSIGLSVGAGGVVIGHILDLKALKTEEKGAEELMRPLEKTGVN